MLNLFFGYLGFFVILWWIFIIPMISLYSSYDSQDLYGSGAPSMIAFRRACLHTTLITLTIILLIGLAHFHGLFNWLF